MNNSADPDRHSCEPLMRIPKGTWKAAALLPIAGAIWLNSWAASEVQSQVPESANVSKTSINPSRDARRSPVSADFEGFTIPKFDVLVAATEIGRLEDVRVEIGDRISKGDVIAKLEDGLQREAVATAQWRAQMRGESEAAKSELALMKFRLEQLRALAKQDVARPDELKRAVADWEIAKSRELGAREQEKLRSLELSRYQLQLERRKILAPMDGVVAEIFHSPGEYITPADPAVIRMVRVDQLYGVFNVSVDEIAQLQAGRNVSVYMMSATRSVRGKITSIAPEIDGESGTIAVKVLIENPNGDLRSGDRCWMKPLQSTAGLSGPRRAIIFQRNAPPTRIGSPKRGNRNR